MATKDFNVNNVPKGVSDPKRLYMDAEFPKHMHKFDMGTDGDEIGDYGEGYTGPTRRFIAANSDEDVDRLLAEGWELAPPPKPRLPAAPIVAPPPAIAPPPAKK